MTEELQRWGDRAMFAAEAHETTEEYGVVPQVYLLWMTPRPLAAIAAMTEMYKGHVIHDLADISNDTMYQALEDVQKTHLRAPLEAVKLHFMLEGVDRAFTHQLVRQRTAVYAQESLRFAVVEDLAHGTTLPPSLFGTTPATADLTSTTLDEMVSEPGFQFITAKDGERMIWDYVIQTIQKGYSLLVNHGMPQEDARGLLPHATATRLNYITDLRNLVDHAGNRLCTQAQFHWRIVFNQIVNEIRNYGGWQFEALADSGMFKPVCYQLGHCPFQASFDRPCKIRDRVQRFAEQGVASRFWDSEDAKEDRIKDEEWQRDPEAARVVAH